MATLNSASNYCVYYVMMEYWKTILANHPSIGFVTQGDIFSTDIKEFPAYPLANIYVDSTDVTKSTMQYNFVLTLLDKPKLIIPDSVDNRNKEIIPYEGIDDVNDIYANLMGIINDVMAYTNNFALFELGNIRAVPFLDRLDNVLAGWTVAFDLTVPNNCFNYCTINLNP
jgi:hypothetical protein